MDADEEDAEQIHGLTTAARDNFELDLARDGAVDWDSGGDGQVDDSSIPSPMLVGGYEAGKKASGASGGVRRRYIEASTQRRR